jgi:hypothetical protein
MANPWVSKSQALPTTEMKTNVNIVTIHRLSWNETKARSRLPTGYKLFNVSDSISLVGSFCSLLALHTSKEGDFNWIFLRSL